MVHAMPRADGGTRLVAPPGWRRPAAGAAPPPHVPRPGGNKQQSERGTDNGHDGGAGHPQPPLDGMRTNVASPGLVVHREFRSVHYAGSRTRTPLPRSGNWPRGCPPRRPARSGQGAVARATGAKAPLTHPSPTLAPPCRLPIPRRENAARAPRTARPGACSSATTTPPLSTHTSSNRTVRRLSQRRVMLG
jgi:hypothetical protein